MEYRFEKFFQKGALLRSPNWLGDAVMALPVIKCLKDSLQKSAPVFVLAPDNLADLYESIPSIAGVVKIGNGHCAWTKEQLNQIKRLNLGVGFLFVNSFRSAWYMRKCVPKLFGASNGIRNLLLTRSFPVRWIKKGSYAEEHQTYKYLSMLYKLGIEKWDGKYPEFEFMDEKDFPDKDTARFIRRKNILAIAPGAAYGPSKRWKEANFNQICRYWTRKMKGNVVILGSRDDFETASKAAEGLDATQVLNIAGKTDLKELMYVLKNSDFCVSNDSGVMHLGAALGIKGIAIFGSTDPYATGPLANKWKVLHKKQSCSPCFSRECNNNLKDYSCLDAISPSEVIKEMNSMLNPE